MSCNTAKRDGEFRETTAVPRKKEEVPESGLDWRDDTLRSRAGELPRHGNCHIANRSGGRKTCTFMAMQVVATSHEILSRCILGFQTAHQVGRGIGFVRATGRGIVKLVSWDPHLDPRADCAFNVQRSPAPDTIRRFISASRLRSFVLFTRYHVESEPKSWYYSCGYPQTN